MQSLRDKTECNPPLIIENGILKNCIDGKIRYRCDLRMYAENIEVKSPTGVVKRIFFHSLSSSDKSRINWLTFFATNNIKQIDLTRNEMELIASLSQ